MEQNKLDELKKFVLEANLNDNNVWAETVCSVVDVLQLTPGLLGSHLQVSRGTVIRWMNGVSSPHEMMREPLRRFVLRYIKDISL